MNQIKFIILLLIINITFIHAQDQAYNTYYEDYPQEYTDPQQSYTSDDNIISEVPLAITNTYEITNYLDITNTLYITNETIIVVTNTKVVHLPDISPISINACVAILKNRKEDLKLFINRDNKLISNTRSDGNNLLHIASTTTNIDIIDYLIHKKVPIDQTNNMGQTPLHIAAQINNIRVAESLLKAKALVNLKDSLGQTSLWIANLKGYPQLLKLLSFAQMNQDPIPMPINNKKILKIIETKVPSNFDLYSTFNKKLIEHGPIYNTPWHKALFSPGYGEIEKLIRSGMNPFNKDIKGQTAFHIAALYDNTDALQYLLNIYPLKTGLRDNFGATPLHTAAGKASPEFVRILLNKGCNIKTKNFGGWNPFFEGVLLGNHQTIRFFLDQGISPNTRTINARTPLHESARLGYDFIVRDLLAKGALYNVADSQGKTPLYLAAEQGHLNILALLYEKGADSTMKSLDNSTALHAAVYHNQLDVVKYLIEIVNANILQTDNLGRTALDIAYIKSFDKIISYLAFKFAENQIKNLNDQEKD